MQRFAHAHQNDIVDLVIAAYGTDLIDNFSRGQIPHQAEASGQAEGALHGTTRLGGNAKSIAAFLHGNQDGFDALPVGEPKKEFTCSITADLDSLTLQF